MAGAYRIRLLFGHVHPIRSRTITRSSLRRRAPIEPRFGCSDERDLTYFGEALFREALPASSSLLDAFTRTQRIIAKREEEEGLDPSQPQIYIGEQMRTKLAELGFAQSR